MNLKTSCKKLGEKILRISLKTTEEMKLSFSRVFAIFAAVLSAWGTISCTSKEPTTNGNTPENVDLAALKKEVVANYAKLVHATYADTLAAAQKLQADLVALTENPSVEALAKARKTWTAARVPYLQTEVFRFYGGPIDDDDGPEGLLNAWPMDEGYIDYVDGNPEAGMINQADKYPEITKELIEELNEKDGETNISTGYHAIEFLLWGQDKSADGPGQRPHTDYSTAANADRRKTYLLAAADLLVENLEGLNEEIGCGRRQLPQDIRSRRPQCLDREDHDRHVDASGVRVIWRAASRCHRNPIAGGRALVFQ